MLVKMVDKVTHPFESHILPDPPFQKHYRRAQRQTGQGHVQPAGYDEGGGLVSAKHFFRKAHAEIVTFHIKLVPEGRHHRTVVIQLIENAKSDVMSLPHRFSYYSQRSVWKIMCQLNGPLT
jgi:hypothetical protein